MQRSRSMNAHGGLPTVAIQGLVNKVKKPLQDFAPGSPLLRPGGLMPDACFPFAPAQEIEV
jgi:hypothetical protein